jgi:xanthine dehydrogenase accessory factor
VIFRQMKNHHRWLVVIRGGGEMATGVAHCFHRSGYRVIILEKGQPSHIRRPVCFAEAVYANEVMVEGIAARNCESIEHALEISRDDTVAVLVDADALALDRLQPDLLVDARMQKKGTDCRIDQAGIVIGLGPGFSAAGNCHAVVETNRGDNLGRVIYKGEAESHTGIPGDVAGYTVERVLRAPCDGILISDRAIGRQVTVGEIIGSVGMDVVEALINGVLRGLVRSGLTVIAGQKIGDIDPRGQTNVCFLISDKANCIGSGAFAAAQHLLKQTNQHQSS